MATQEKIFSHFEMMVDIAKFWLNDAERQLGSEGDSFAAAYAPIRCTTALDSLTALGKSIAEQADPALKQALEQKYSGTIAQLTAQARYLLVNGDALTMESYLAKMSGRRAGEFRYYISVLLQEAKEQLPAINWALTSQPLAKECLEGRIASIESKVNQASGR